MLQLIDEDTKKEAKKKKSKKKRKRADNQPSLSAPETASLPPFGAHIRQMMTGYGDGFYTRPETIYICRPGSAAVGQAAQPPPKKPTDPALAGPVRARCLRRTRWSNC
jgi:hypothetical protein